jgi:hypothetical protein
MIKVRFAARNVNESTKSSIRNYAKVRGITMGKAFDEIIWHAQQIIKREKMS